MSEIINRVSQSALKTIDLADYYHKGERVVYDIAPHLFQGLILREKDFREAINQIDWAAYTGKNVALTCSVDAIVPTWAYMLLTLKLTPYCHKVIFGTLTELEVALYQEALAQIPLSNYQNQRVVVKGCGDLPVPIFAYTEITRLLSPIVAALMFGEPCSTVPLYKKARN
jgi:hypothetical protein